MLTNVPLYYFMSETERIYDVKYNIKGQRTRTKKQRKEQQRRGKNPSSKAK